MNEPTSDPSTTLPPDELPVDGDDLDEVVTPMTRLAGVVRRLLAAVLVVGLLVPAGRWLADEIDFRRSGAAVVATLEGERSGTAAGATVLLVRTVGCAGRGGSGSAFVVSTPDGPVVVTNRHVVEGARQVGLRALDGDQDLRVGSVRLADDTDVAVLEVADPQRLPPPLRLREDPAVPGESVRVVGFPAARPFTDAGEVAATGVGRLLLDLQVSAGASGSPVVDGDGAVVGQVRAVTADGQGVATPSGVLAAAIDGARPSTPPC